MIEVLVCAITSIPILAAAFFGYSIGAERLISFGGKIAVGWIAGILTALSCLSAGWLQPFGLLTPILLGLLVAVTVRRFARRPLEGFVNGITRRLACILPRQRVWRSAGAVLGAGAGTALAASLWLGAALANGALPAQSAPLQDGHTASGEKAAGAVEALLRTAHHGFVRHIPVLGPLGDEVEALTFILNADPRLRAELAHVAGWEHLAELPTLNAIFEDPNTLEDLDGVRKGNLAAIYRLQKNPLILAFFEESDVRKVILEMRPSELARRLEALKAANDNPSHR